MIVWRASASYLPLPVSSVTGEVTTRKTRSTRPVLAIACDARRQKDVIVLAHNVVLAVDLHQAFAFEHVVDLLLHLVPCTFT